MTRIRFEDLPSTNTPRNAENLNKLNNVVISSSEPTTGEEVWIQKGKNLFNKNDVLHGYWINNGIVEANALWSTSNFIEVKPNTPYSFSSTLISGASEIQTTIIYYDVNKIRINSSYFQTLTKTETTPSNCCYVRVLYRNDVQENVQLEQGSATTYEPYIDKKIYTKNDNDVYEKFYDETKLENYSLAEKRIGNWVDGKPLYEKTYVSNSTTVNLDNIPYGFLFAHEVIVELSTGATFSTGRSQGETDYFTYYAYKNDKIVSIDLGSTWTMVQAIVKVRYTKTTD